MKCPFCSYRDSRVVDSRAVMMAFLFGVVENVLIVDAGSLLMKNMRKLL
mgnify:CR=1 FL=1